MNELQGEKIDIIPWSADAATFIVNALAPAEVAKVVLDEEAERIEVVVPDEQLSLAIGRRGQNVRLASQLTGWDIDIMTEADESERRQKEFAERTRRFIDALDVDEMLAQLLASEGFSTVEDVAFIAANELSGLEGIDEEMTRELQARARDYLERKSAEQDARRTELGVRDELKDIEGATGAMLVAFGEAGILSIEDLAGCATDDLIGWTERKGAENTRHKGALSELGVSAPEAEAMIMAARVKAGWIEPPAAEAAKPATELGRRWRREPQRSRAMAEAERMCIVTRTVREADAMIRFVLGPGNEVVPDLRRQLPGRGVWVTANSRTLALAIKEKRFARAFKRGCHVDADLAERTAALLRRDARELLSLANKAGLVVAGYEKTAAMLASRSARILLAAADGAADGRRKLRARKLPGCEVVDIFTSSELDLALGRANVIHAAVANGGLAERLLNAARRVAFYEKLDFDLTEPTVSA